MSGSRSASREAPGDAPNSAIWPLSFSVGRRLRAAQDRLGRREQPRAVRLQRIEGAGADQVLELHPVELPRIDAGGEIREIGERRVAARLGQRLHGGEADLLHRGQRIADRQLAIVRAFHREVGARAVDVGRQDADARARRLLAQRGQPVGVAERQAHAGGDEHRGVVRLHPRGLIGEQSVRRRMAFVEAIVGELRHQIEDFRGLLRIDAAGDGAFGEDARAAPPSRRGSSCPSRAAADRRRPASSRAIFWAICITCSW